MKSDKQIEFCGCIIAGVHGAFAAGSSILGVLFDANLNHLDLHGKLIKIKNLFYVKFILKLYKIVCVFSMVVVSILLHAELEDESHFKFIFQILFFFNFNKFFFFTFMAI